MVGVIPEGLESVAEFFPRDPISSSENGFMAGTPIEKWNNMLDFGHQKIDQIFSTDQAHRYTPEAKESAASSLSGNMVYGILPPPVFTGSSGRIAATMASDVWGWKVGQEITNRTAFGTVPKWNTVRRRYWKNRAEWAKSNSGQTEYFPEQVERMEKGLAPQRENFLTGQLESKELHHTPPQREGGLFDFIEVWPDEHADLDGFRNLGR